jgi:hypothetical protein
MNAKRMGLLATLVITMTLFGGMIASGQITCVPSQVSTANAQPYRVCPISQNPYFINSYNGQVNNLIFSGNALSDLGTWIAGNLGSLLVLAIVIVLALGIWDIYQRRK